MITSHMKNLDLMFVYVYVKSFSDFSHNVTDSPSTSGTVVIMADQESLVAQFTAVSGVDVERAKFYLESAAWSLEVIRLCS